MRENMADHFKFTRKSGRFVFLSLVAVPTILLIGAYKFGVSINFFYEQFNDISNIVKKYYDRVKSIWLVDEEQNLSGEAIK